MSALLFILILVCSVSPVKGDKNVDSLLSVIKSQQFPATEDAANELIGLLYLSDSEAGLALSRKLLKETANIENQFFYISFFIHSYQFYPFEKKLEILNHGAKLAHSENLPNLIATAYSFISMSYRNYSMPDSAMTYALMAKNVLDETADSEVQDAINQLIGDMHFYAGENDEAEKIYSKLMEREKYFGKHWRYITLRNNLGLIKLKQYKFDEAEDYFRAAFQKRVTPPMNRADSVGMIYDYRKLMEVKLAKGEYKEAEEFCEKGKYYANKIFTKFELPGLYIGYAQILRHKGKYDSAHTVLTLAENLDKEYPDMKNKVALSRERALNYKAEGNFKEASVYLEQWVKDTQVSDSVYNRAKLLHMYAEHNYLILQNRAEGLKREKNLIFAILLMSIATLLILVTYYFRLRKSYKLLVEKNLELAYSETSVPIPVMERYETGEETPLENSNETQQQKKEIDESLLGDIADKLERMIQEEKIYLLSDLTTVNGAERLGTNRTYLSQAVRFRYGMSYPDLINGHRIRQAIQIMNSDDSRSMTIDSIAEKSGFNNRVTFSKVFQHHTGVSPSFFLKDIWGRNKAGE